MKKQKFSFTKITPNILKLQSDPSKFKGAKYFVQGEDSIEYFILKTLHCATQLKNLLNKQEQMIQDILKLDDKA